MHTFKHISAAFAASLIAFLAFAGVAQAETHITSGYLKNGGYWEASSSPYIVEDPITVPPGQSLYIGPGVSVIASSSIQGYSLFNVQGYLSLDGRASAHVRVSGPGAISISGGTTSIAYADITEENGVAAFNSFVRVASSSISGASQGIHVRSSDVRVDNTGITGNGYGIFVESSAPSGIFPAMRMDGAFGTGGIGNALDDGPDGSILAQSAAKAAASLVIVASSSILDNNIAAIVNRDNSTVEAIGDWWGSDAGPSFLGVNSISGLVDYSPWLKATVPKTICCSSVLFIPGLEGTRLYRPESLIFGLGKTVNTLWEPNRSADVQKLYLNANGSSTDLSIYSGDPIGKALGISDIYGRFISFLDGLVGNGTINEWKAFGYDWRRPIADVVAGPEKKATTTLSLVELVGEMASSSKTGKVTLVAHSNGGLVAKYLTKVLADMGRSNLIDTVISVAVPYLGTPEAIGGLLHGDDQSLGAGIILRQAVARDLGVNMPSAYSLLPSAEYFWQVAGPTIAFASTTVVGVNNGSYPQEIATHDGQSAYIANALGGRSNASPSDTSLPVKGNQALLAAADALHAVLDQFSWPSTIANWAIVGWNKATTKGIEYLSKLSCHGGVGSFACLSVATHDATTTIMGDGTVVAPSAAYGTGSGKIISADLKAISANDGVDVSHANILESSSTETAIADIITGSSTDGIPGISMGEPDYSKEPSFLKISTHSPVELDIYDREGRHTGTIPKPAQLTDVEDGLYTFTEEKIPGSRLESVGGTDDDPEYQAYLPDDNGETYSVVLNGTGIGEFTLDIDRIKNGSNVDNVEYAMMPVTPLTLASTTIVAGASPSASTMPLSSTTPPLQIDIDGDGAVDMIASSTSSNRPLTFSTSSPASGRRFNPINYFDLMRKAVASMAGNMPRGKNILTRIDKLEDAIKKGKLKKEDNVALQLGRRVNHLKFKGLSDTDRQQTLDMFDAFLAQFER